MKIKELLTDKSKWTQDTFAITVNGDFCLPNDPAAISWCLQGAAHKCYPSVFELCKVTEQIRLAIDDVVTWWNDAPERTFEEVKTLVEKLDI